MYRRFTQALLEGLTGRGWAKAATAVATAPAPAPAAEMRPTVEVRVVGKHVLLLDDEEAILVPTSKYLRSLGWTVDVCRETEEGEALISHRHYDLAILDVRVTRF